MSPQACYPDKAPEINTLCDTLGHHLRRELIYYFEECTDAESATYDELLTHLHNRLPDANQVRLKCNLVHKHLPKLADRDWISYDPRSEEIRYYGHETAAPLLRDLHAVFADSPDSLSHE